MDEGLQHTYTGPLRHGMKAIGRHAAEGLLSCALLTRTCFIISALFFILQPAKAQFRTDRLIDVGKSALYYEDYVLSIQYFNQVIGLKPYLYEPWFLRGLAKFYLDDYVGADKDCSEAINLNPYIPDIFELRALCNIRQRDFQQAIDDYDKTIGFLPDNKNLWYNRVLCRIEQKDYDHANKDLDSMMTRWKNFAKSYSLKAEVLLLQKDTVQGAKFLDKSLEIDPYDGNLWAMRAMISLSRKKWKDADAQLSKAIHLKPTTVDYYVNRALARYNINNLRGAMADYDKALEIDPNNFLAHYNRGQLRIQVGDDNRAIDDFDYIISKEPDNVMAIYNRAILLERTGNLRGAIADYTTIINQFPNFWAGLNNRARCYRKLGMTAKAEMDEFRIFKAQMDKHYGQQQRWSKKTKDRVRKKSEIDFDKYNQLVVEDEQKVDHEYSSAFRGRVQDRETEIAFMPMFQLSFTPYGNGVKVSQVYNREVDAFNHQWSKNVTKASHPIYVTCHQKPLTETESQKVFAMIDTLGAAIAASKNIHDDRALILQRAVAHSGVQNHVDAINDLTIYIQEDSTSALAYWQRAVCQAKLNQYKAAKGTEAKLALQGAADDINKAMAISKDNACLYYNRGNLWAMGKAYDKAIADYSEAIRLDSNLAEAYFNRGIAYARSGKTDEAISDLSKAGELGLFNAYSAIKKFSKAQKETEKKQ
ncbi:MAG: tetratricopeptide repeat protein [Bacteroidales bacterium]|nr:tetratricopeptide repeat protein [Bacteroidales bacterium]